MTTLSVPSSSPLLRRSIAASLHNGTIGIRQLHGPPSSKSFFDFRSNQVPRGAPWKRPRVNFSIFRGFASAAGQGHATDSTTGRTVDQRTACRCTDVKPKALQSLQTSTGADECHGIAPPLMRAEVRRSEPSLFTQNTYGDTNNSIIIIVVFISQFRLFPPILKLFPCSRLFPDAHSIDTDVYACTQEELKRSMCTFEWPMHHWGNVSHADIHLHLRMHCTVVDNALSYNTARILSCTSAYSFTLKKHHPWELYPKSLHVYNNAVADGCVCLYRERTKYECLTADSAGHWLVTKRSPTVIQSALPQIKGNSLFSLCMPPTRCIWTGGA